MVERTDPKGTKAGSFTARFPQDRAGLAAPLWRPAQACAKAAGDPLITEIQDWNRYLGDGVDAAPYGSRRSSRRMWCAAMCRG
jgi:sulfane dehydrogenase subunit SoxC